MPGGAHGSKFTEARQEALVKALREGHTIRDACALAGIHHTQFYRWVERGESSRPGSRYRAFSDAVAEAEALLMADALAVVRTGMRDDPKWAAWLLERRRPDDYGRRERHEVTGAGGAPIKVELAWPQGPQPPT